MIPVIVDLSGIDPHKKVNSVTREERAKLAALLKKLDFAVTGTRPVEEAIITSGGVNVKEIDPKTMESKLVKGLYFAGEVIDVDALTGGYNMHIAMATGALAGENAAK
jgi:predicted Rossmann fold flavoprotein